jgi:hypothetical protein
MTLEINNRIDFLKYLNTIILTVIAILSSIVFFKVNCIQNLQQEQAKEIIRIKTIQDANTLSIASLLSRMNALEQYNQSVMKQWVDDNYVRLPQNKMK